MNKIWKTFSVLACLMITLCCTSCFGGDVKDIEIKDTPSEVYSKKDIKSAEEVIVDEFDKDWDGCSLYRIGYAGDDRLEDFKDHAENENEEVIVLTSDFHVDSTGGNGSLNQDFTYKDWKWILVREKGGEWTHVDHTAM